MSEVYVDEDKLFENFEHGLVLRIDDLEIVLCGSFEVKYKETKL